MTARILIAGRSIARIGLGTNRLGTATQPETLLRAARDLGVELLDTAASYAGSEASIGRYRDVCGDAMLIATKGGFGPDNSPATIRREISESLSRLGLRQLPLYFLHRIDPRRELTATMEVLAAEVDAGRIGAIGLSEVTVEQVEQARSVVPIVAVQNRFHLMDRTSQAVVDHCTAEGIVFVAYSPLGRGDVLRHPRVPAIARRHGVDARTVALAWLLATSPAVLPIPATLSVPHLRANMAAMDLSLSPREMDALSMTGRAGPARPLRQ